MPTRKKTAASMPLSNKVKAERASAGSSTRARYPIRAETQERREEVAAVTLSAAAKDWRNAEDLDGQPGMGNERGPRGGMREEEEGCARW